MPMKCISVVYANSAAMLRCSRNHRITTHHLELHFVPVSEFFILLFIATQNDNEAETTMLFRLCHGQFSPAFACTIADVSMLFRSIVSGTFRSRRGWLISSFCYIHNAEPICISHPPIVLVELVRCGASRTNIRWRSPWHDTHNNCWSFMCGTLFTLIIVVKMYYCVE